MTVEMSSSIQIESLSHREYITMIDDETLSDMTQAEIMFMDEIIFIHVMIGHARQLPSSLSNVSGVFPDLIATSN